MGETKYLYIFKGRKGFYKIGISDNVHSRLASIRTSNPDQVDIIIARKIQNAFALEQELHRKYSHKISRTSGEWFMLSSEDIIDICIEVHKADGEKPKIEDRSVEKILQRFLSNQEEIKNSLAFLKTQQARSSLIERKNLTMDSDNRKSLPEFKITKKHDDLLIKNATEIVIKEGRASASLLQRKLSIGYARAARIIDKLEELGIVGPLKGSLPRTVKSPFGSQLSYGDMLISDEPNNTYKS
ncbi:MAG: DNA segregation ATPase FtsK/SpoIIIE, S-DNA-T family [Microgenomates group bacterium Gr01-1014_7]|nr:MAG: DNA segregation ATPase FtsK/SpoIIIE, S-DNA-T family [Microgenomates group bacterium Gr01-1014_7]